MRLGGREHPHPPQRWPPARGCERDFGTSLALGNKFSLVSTTGLRLKPCVLLEHLREGGHFQRVGVRAANLPVLARPVSDATTNLPLGPGHARPLGLDQPLAPSDAVTISAAHQAAHRRGIILRPSLARLYWMHLFCL